MSKDDDDAIEMPFSLEGTIGQDPETGKFAAQMQIAPLDTEEQAEVFVKLMGDAISELLCKKVPGMSFDYIKGGDDED